jgi:kynurenine formamidase
MDAPLHFGCGDQATIDNTPMSHLLTTAYVVRLPETKPADVITVEQLGSLAKQFVAGNSLLLHTGWSKHVGNDGLYRQKLPRISESLARWCVDAKVAVLGVEPPSVADVNNLPEVTQIHNILLGGGVTIVEGLTNLESLPDEAFLFGAFPLKVFGGDGAPCRAFASTEDLTIQ